MYNIKRPSTKETQNDLIELDAILRKQLTEIQKKEESDPKEEASKRKSNSSGINRRKKKKENLIDYSVFEEAVNDTNKKAAVLGKIVIRDVTGAEEYMKNWKGLSSKNGFPVAPKLTILDHPELHEKGKSFYIQQLEMEGKLRVVKNRVQNKPFSLGISTSCDGKRDSSGSSQDVFNTDPSEQLDQSMETDDKMKIHEENVSTLSSMSEEEICKKREELRKQLMQNNNMKTLEFIKSRARKVPNKEMAKSSVEIDDKMETEESLTASAPKESSSMSLSDLSLPVEDLKPLMECGIEYNKLKWMSEVPKPKPLKNGEGYIARFNFEGDLLPYDTDISIQKGLHHHGNEPGRAGYTIDELFILVRSNVVQQRNIGLKVLANILRNAKEGLYDKCFDQSVIQLMVDAGLVILLRFAIDETTALVYQEGLRAMYYLVCSEPDEKCLDLVSSWSPHSTVPGISSKSHSKKKEREELDKEEKELKDVEILQLDIIRALIRMDTHLRMRYFIKTVHPTPPDVIHILGILSRMARHSLAVAWSLAQCPGLLASIAENFMPHTLGSLLTGSNSLNVKSVYGFPLRHAVTFMKVMCSRGRHLAALICKLPNIMQSLLTYVSVEPSDIQMPKTEIMQLAVQSYSLWATLMSYGLEEPQEAFISFYSMFIKQLIYYRDKVDADDADSSRFNYDIGTMLGHVLTKALLVGSRYTLMNHHQTNSIPLVTGSNGKREVLTPPLLRWQMFSDVFKLIEECLRKWFVQLSMTSGSFCLLRMVGSFLNFVTAYVDNLRYQDDFNGSSMCHETHKVFQMVGTFITSNRFGELLNRTKKYSILCSDLICGECRDPHNMSSLGSVCRGGEIVPLLQNGSPFALLLPLTSFMQVLFTQNPSVDNSLLDNLLDNNTIVDYITAINKSNAKIATNWFARIEIFTVCNFLQLASMKGKYSQLLHETAVCLVPLIQKGDEHLIRDVIDVICNKSFATDFLSIEWRVEAMHIDKIDLPSPVSSQTQNPSPLSEITEDVLHSAGRIIINSILTEGEINASNAKKSGVFFLINSLTQDSETKRIALDGYWSLQLLQTITNRNRDNNCPQDLQLGHSVRKILTLTYLLLKYRNNCLFRYTNKTGWFRYLSLLFTASNDLFLDCEVSKLVQGCLREILKEDGFAEINPTVSLPGMQFCFDWYRSFVDQFSAVSYDDSTFALFVILPQQMIWPDTYRILLWDDFMPSLSFVKLTCAQVDQFVPVKGFLYPPEKNENVINCYHRAIQGGFIHPQKTPFLYYVAYHHIKHQET